MNLDVWPFDRPMPRAILQHPHNKTPMPDIANLSWVEYGLRTGVPRLEGIFTPCKMIFALERHSDEEYYKRFKDTAGYSASEPDRPPRVITMGLQPHIIAVPSARHVRAHHRPC